MGIGTTSPVAKLSLQGTAGANDMFDVASSTGTSVLRITNQGNVGIGTTNPGQLLDVNGVAAFGGSSAAPVNSTNKIQMGYYASGIAPFSTYGWIQAPSAKGLQIWDSGTSVIAAFGKDGGRESGIFQRQRRHRDDESRE